MSRRDQILRHRSIFQLLHNQLQDQKTVGSAREKNVEVLMRGLTLPTFDLPNHESYRVVRADDENQTTQQVKF